MTGEHIPGQPQPKSLKDLVNVVSSEFFTAYVYFLKAKGQVTLQTLNETSNSLSHLLQYVIGINPDTNLDRAISHISRATLDLHKMHWAVIHRKIGPKRLHHPVWEQCFSQDPGDIRKSYDEFVALSEKARIHEAENIGTGTATTLALYNKATHEGTSLHDSFDKTKFVVAWGLWFLRGAAAVAVGASLTLLLPSIW
jgi:hypothetical protein